MEGDLAIPELGTISRLAGAALALGADSLPGLSEPERKALVAAEPARFSGRESRLLKEAIQAGLDPLGDAFCEIFSAAERRRDGAIYTPEPIVRSMVEWAADGPVPGRIVDPGSGSARFAIAAGHAFSKAELVAIEVDPIAALISRANLVAQGMGRRAQVRVEDYRRFAPPPIAKPTLYIGNPPYVRHHQISKAWKTWLTNTARKHGLSASQMAGLHVHFFLATALRASPGDRGAFITSSEWLDVNYGSLVRELLLDGMGGQSIHVIDPAVRPFENAQTTGAIICFEIGSAPRSIRLQRVKSVKDLDHLAGGRRVRRERLAEARRWSQLLRAPRKVPDGHIELGELCKVHRGAATGANRTWVVDSTTSSLPSSVLFPTVTRARELFAAGEELADVAALRMVVDLPQDLDSLDPEERRQVERFLRRARSQGAHRSYLAKHRNSWWSVGLREAAPILTTYMARRVPAIVRNSTDARHINIAHGLYPREPLSQGQLDRLAEALRSSITVRQGRTYAGGLTKFEPGELARLPVPNVLLADG